LPRASPAKQVYRLHELKPQLRRVRVDSQIATTLAVCELVFIPLLNEIVRLSAGWCLQIQNSDQKSLRLCINRRRDLLALSANSQRLLTRSLSWRSGSAILIPSHEQPAESGPDGRRKEAHGIRAQAIIRSRLHTPVFAENSNSTAPPDSSQVIKLRSSRHFCTLR
jgi:hypothetical protein